MLRGWSEGIVGNKTFQQITEEFAEIVIPKVWLRENRKISRVADSLSISPQKSAAHPVQLRIAGTAFDLVMVFCILPMTYILFVSGITHDAQTCESQLNLYNFGVRMITTQRAMTGRFVRVSLQRIVSSVICGSPRGCVRGQKLYTSTVLSWVPGFQTQTSLSSNSRK
jgi:hypothetical protein